MAHGTRTKSEIQRLKNFANPTQEIAKKAPYRKDIYKKAYLLEFYKGTTIQDVFCFSVPPESEDFSYTYRINETKTFGGSCIDFYGHDLYKISLSGSTINQEVKTIFRGGYKPNESLTGEEEVFRLQSLLETYANETLNGKSELVLYDLSKNKATSSASKDYIIGCYTVYPTDFKIKRSKDKPFTFNYSIDFMAHSRKYGSYYLADKTITKENKPWYETFFEAFDKVKFILNTPLNLTNAIISDFGDVSKQILQALEIPANYARAIIGVGENMQTTVRDVESRANLIAYKYASFTKRSCFDKAETGLKKESSVESAQSLKDSLKRIDELIDKCRKYQKPENQTVETRTLESTENKDIATIMKENEFYYLCIKSCILSIYADLKKESIVLLETLDMNGNKSVIPTYGFTSVPWQQGKSLNKIAFEQYGDESFAFMLMQYNEIKSEEEIPLGKMIKCPKLAPISNDERIKVYSSTDKIYGCDLCVDENGNVLTENGDFGTVQGSENLNQAIITRLTSHSNTKLKALTVGIIDAIGDPEIASSFVIESVKQTLQDEPRIRTVNRIEFVGKGNMLSVDISYTDVSSQNNSLNVII